MNPIKRAARIIDHHFLAPRRRRKLMAVLGVDDLTTKIDVARKQHKPSRAAQSALSARVHDRLRMEVGNG